MRRNVIGYESHDRSRSAAPDLPCQKSILQKKHYYVPFYFANENIFYAEDRAKMNRELTLFCSVGNWISGAADRTRQHDAVMAFITIISRANFDPCK